MKMRETSVKDLVITVDGVNVPDYELIKELYGEQMVKEIKNLVSYYHYKNYQWDLKVIRENGGYADVVLYTSFSSNLYEINLEKKIISSESSVGSVVCEELLDLMNSLKN
jgi:hypothetical protein